MAFDHRVGDVGTPFDCANRQNGEASIFGKITKAVRIVTLTLAAQPSDAMGWNIVEHICWNRHTTEPFQSIEKIIDRVGCVAWLMIAQPNKASDCPRRNRFRKKRLQPLSQSGIETTGDPCGDGALGSDQGIGAMTFDGARPGTMTFLFLSSSSIVAARPSFDRASTAAAASQSRISSRACPSKGR